MGRRKDSAAHQQSSLWLQLKPAPQLAQVTRLIATGGRCLEAMAGLFEIRRPRESRCRQHLRKEIRDAALLFDGTARM
jgi:hypothetical protein